jgi:hypothetical protein
MDSKMDRRTGSRMDLRLSCRIDGAALISEKSGYSTENISRNGLLLQWTRPTPRPAIGTMLRVEVELPSDGIVAPRLIRCDCTVVRVITDERGRFQIGLKVHAMRFVDDPRRMWPGDLNAATLVQETVN